MPMQTNWPCCCMPRPTTVSMVTHSRTALLLEYTPGRYGNYVCVCTCAICAERLRLRGVGSATPRVLKLGSYLTVIAISIMHVLHLGSPQHTTAYHVPAKRADTSTAPKSMATAVPAQSIKQIKEDPRSHATRESHGMWHCGIVVSCSQRLLFSTPRGITQRPSSLLLATVRRCHLFSASAAQSSIDNRLSCCWLPCAGARTSPRSARAVGHCVRSYSLAL